MSMDEHDNQAIEEAIDATLETLTAITKGYDPRPKHKQTTMNEHIEVIVQCAAKFPELRFGQFLCAVLDTQYAKEKHRVANFTDLFYSNDRDLAEQCKTYCKEMGR